MEIYRCIRQQQKNSNMCEDIPHTIESLTMPMKIFVADPCIANAFSVKAVQSPFALGGSSSASILTGQN